MQYKKHANSGVRKLTQIMAVVSIVWTDVAEYAVKRGRTRKVKMCACATLDERNVEHHSLVMFLRRLVLVVAGCLCVSLALAAAPAAAQPSAEPGDPMRIAILVDNSTSVADELPLVRRGLQQFFSSLPPNHELMLVATGGQMNIRVQPTRDYLTVAESAGALQPMRFAGNALIASVQEVYERYLRKVERRYPMLVIVANAGPDMSQGLTRENVNTLLRQLTASHVRVNALLLNPAGDRGMLGSDLVRSFTVEMIKRTDGALETASPVTSPAKLKALAGRIAQQYTQISPGKAPSPEFRR
jgi:hypothetical protein